MEISTMLLHDVKFTFCVNATSEEAFTWQR